MNEALDIFFADFAVTAVTPFGELRGILQALPLESTLGPYDTQGTQWVLVAPASQVTPITVDDMLTIDDIRYTVINLQRTDSALAKLWLEPHEHCTE